MKTVIFASVLLLPLAAQGQSFNCDLDIFDGGPSVGEGAPSDAFGGPANQPGRWNQLNAASGTPRFLIGLEGQLTNVLYRKSPGGGAAGGFNNPLNTGDYALLLNDIMFMGGQPITLTLSGLQNGWYRVFTLAVKASLPPQYSPTEIFVPGSSTPNPQIATGPMPGNSFEEGITHSVHEVFVGDNILHIIISDSNPTAQINGFQIVAVPEPFTVGSLGFGLLVLFRRLKRRRS